MNTSGKRGLSFRNPYQQSISDVTTFDNRSGMRLPDWRQRMLRGLDCSTPYTRTSKTVEIESSGFWEHKTRERSNSLAPWYYWTGTAHGQFLGSQAPPTFAVPVEVENRVKARFLDKMVATQKSFSSITALGELRQTLNGLRHPLDALRKGFSQYINLVEKRGMDALKRRKKRRFKRGTLASDRWAASKAVPIDRARLLSQVITGTYLEFVFGIQPTLNDIQSACHAVESLQGKLFDRKNLHASEHFEVNQPKVAEASDGSRVMAGLGPIGNPQSGAQPRFYTSIKGEGTIRYSGMIAVKTDSNQVKSQFGLMPRDFICDVWNFLPWSWAIDYAFNVGNVLQAISAPYSSMCWANRAVYTELRVTTSSDGFDDAVGYGINREFISLSEKSPSRVSALYRSYGRSLIEPNVGSFMPEFHLGIPGLKQMLNLAAVAYQHAAVSKKLFRAQQFDRITRLDSLHLIR